MWKCSTFLVLVFLVTAVVMDDTELLAESLVKIETEIKEELDDGGETKGEENWPSKVQVNFNTPNGAEWDSEEEGMKPPDTVWVKEGMEGDLQEAGKTAMESKKTRSSNFTDKEVELLLALVKKHIHVIENKKSNAVTWRAKEKIWAKLANQFNVAMRTTRSTKSLRNKYELLKKSVRRKSAEIQQNILKDGKTSSSTILLPVEQKLKDMMQLNIDGLSAEVECDSESTDDIAVIADAGENESSDNICIEEFIVNLEHEENTGEPSSSTENGNASQSAQEHLVVWDSWNHGALQKQTSAKVSNNLRWKGTKKGAHNRYLHDKYTSLGEIRTKESRERIRRENEEHVLKMEILEKESQGKTRRAEEEHTLRLEILKRELEIKNVTLQKLKDMDKPLTPDISKALKLIMESNQLPSISQDVPQTYLSNT